MVDQLVPSKNDILYLGSKNKRILSDFFTKMKSEKFSNEKVENNHGHPSPSYHAISKETISTLKLFLFDVNIFTIFDT